MRCSLEETAAVLERVLTRELKIGRAARQLGLGPKQTRRLLQRYLDDGLDGLRSRRKGRPDCGFSREFKERVIGLIRTQYADFGPTFAAEKLEEREGIKVSREWLRVTMMEAGIWLDKVTRRPKLHQLREPCERKGELVQIDGSHHRWFEDRGAKCALLVFIDDATSEIGHLQFAASEDAMAYMSATKAYISKHGKPVAFYSDKHSIFRNPKANLERGEGETQFGRVLRNLNIEIICADSSEAKGRVERANRTLQDRLVKELRLAGISTIEAANEFVETYVARHNANFARDPFSPIDAHRPVDAKDFVDDLVRWEEQRKVSGTLALHYNKVMFILEDSPLSRKLKGKYVTVCEFPDGRVEVQHDGVSFPYRTFDKLRRVNQPEVVGGKRLDAALEFAKQMQALVPHHRKRNAAAPARRSQPSHMFRDFELSPKGARIGEDGACTSVRGHEVRTVSRQLSIQYKNVRYVIEETMATRALIGQEVTVLTRTDGTVEIRHDGELLAYRARRYSNRRTRRCSAPNWAEIKAYSR